MPEAIPCCYLATADMKDDIYFGTGTATFGMSGTSYFEGNVDLAGSLGTLTLGDTARFAGTLSNANNLDVIVNGGSFGASEVCGAAV